MDVSPYVDAGVVRLRDIAGQLTGGADGSSRRPVYTIFNVAVGCGALVSVKPTHFKWATNVPALPADSCWPQVMLEVRHQQLCQIKGSMSLTAQVMGLRWQKKWTVNNIAASLGVQPRRVYEVAALLTSLGVMKRVGRGASYKWAKNCRLKPPSRLPKRQAESPPSSIETRATRRRRKQMAEAAERGEVARALFPQLAAEKPIPSLPEPLASWDAPFELPLEVSAFDEMLGGPTAGALIY